MLKMVQKECKTEHGTVCYWVNEFVEGRKNLVFLPGLTASNRLFEKQTEYFSSFFNCFVWDAPGHAKSRPFNLNISLDQKAQILFSILQTENFSKPVLIGQSMGGYVAQSFMQLFPGEAAGFVSVDSCPLQKKYVTAFEIWALRNVEPVFRLYPWKSLLTAGAAGCSTTRYGQQLMAQMMSEYDKDYYSVLSGAGFRMLADAYASDRPYIIDCPAILICGTRDRAGSAKRYNTRWVKETGLKIFWLVGAGHNSNCDRPEETNRIIEDFVNSL